MLTTIFLIYLYSRLHAEGYSFVSLSPYFGVMILSVIIFYLGWKIFKYYGVLDRPGPDVPKRNKVPKVLGIFIMIGFLLNILIFFNDLIYLKEVLGLLLGGSLIGLIALIDDFIHVNPKVRLLAQVFSAVIAFFVGGVGFHELMLPGGYLFEFSMVASLLLTIVWFVVFINAINWFDGIYGMASGVSSIGFLTIMLLIKFVVMPGFPMMEPDTLANMNLVLDLSFVLFVLSFISTLVEFKPLGLVRDVGTMFMGFSLAYLAILGGAKIGTILVVLALVIFDAVWVLINRIYKMRKNPLKGDLSHLHHRLLAMKWSRTEIRFFIWGWSLFLMILMILQGVNRTNKIIIFVMMFLIFFGVNIYLFWVKKFPIEFDPKTQSK